MRVATLLAVAGLAIAPAAAQGLAPPFTDEERAAIIAHGPWPPPSSTDPSNRVSGDARAIALGRKLFHDKRLSSDNSRSCASCHKPDRAFADGHPRSIGLQPTDRNAIALANLRLNRWFGWSGATDSLWAHSIRPILDERELGLSPSVLQHRLASDRALAAEYAHLFGHPPNDAEPEMVLVNTAKALAAFQETIVTPRTPFDDFRDALARGDRLRAARYPQAAQRGLRIFVGVGRCTACHTGPNFTNGEFEDVGIPFFAEKGRVDPGRHGGITALRKSPFNLLSRYNDNPVAATGLATLHVEQLHRNWGEFRVPSLRNVSRTAPYMHNGSLATLADVVRHYSEIDEERLHGTPDKRLLRPLRLSPREKADLVAFLETLSGRLPARKRHYGQRR
jgi:cytochrome c peroxidase